MENFLCEKNGYKKNDVDIYIFKIEKDLENANNSIKNLEAKINEVNKELLEYKQKENIISESIESAIAFSNQIKQKNKTLFLNEINNFKSLYKKWNDFLDRLNLQYPDTALNFSSDLILKSLAKAIDDILKQKESKKQSSNNYVKTIISNANSGKKDNFKYIIVRNKKPSQKSLLNKEAQNQFIKECSRLNISQSNKTLNNNNNSFSSLENKENQKFDLKEAINPTMELEEIMKFFDIEK